MNSFIRSTPLDWADALPKFSAFPPQDDIAANGTAGSVGILDRVATSIQSSNISGDPENPLYEIPPFVSTQTPWLAETLLQTRGPLLGLSDTVLRSSRGAPPPLAYPFLN